VTLGEENAVSLKEEQGDISERVGEEVERGKINKRGKGKRGEDERDFLEN
jgi:hypothetical protein